MGMLKYEYIADPLNAMHVDLHCIFLTAALSKALLHKLKGVQVT